MAVTSKGKKLQSEMVGSVNGILKAFDLLPFWDKLNTDGEYFLETPLALILQLCQAMGLMDELRDWLAQYVIYAIPALELGIKGSLLANMMASIQCTTKITIPEEARMFYFNRVFRATAPYINEEGLEYYQNKHTTVYEYTGTTAGFKKTLTEEEYKSLAQVNKDKYEKKTVAEITPNEGGQKSLYKSGDYVFLTQKIDGTGIPVPIWSIDYSDLLSHCPWSLGYVTLPNERAAEYFGVPQDEYEEVDAIDMYGTPITKKDGTPVKRMVKTKDADKSPYQLARCIDCNAFLWFVKNKGRFRQPTIITEDSTFEQLWKKGLMSYKTITSDGTNSKFNSLVNGSCITSYDPSYGSDKTHACRWLSVITNVVRDEQDNVTSFKVMPVVSNGSRSTYLSPDINWYVNDKDYFTVNIGIDETTKNKPESKTQARINSEDYMNEFRPICSFNYNDGAHCFNVKVLPEPFIHYPVIVPRHKDEEGNSVKPYHEPLTRLRKILFDAQGRPSGVASSKARRFTVVPYVNDASSMVYKDVDTAAETCTYALTNFDGSKNNTIVLVENMKDGTYKLQKLNGTSYQDIDYSDNSTDNFLIAPILFECYKGLTVYQFNYDMIMGMKMLNGRSLVAALIDTLLGINIHVGLTQEQKQAQKIIISIVEEMINANEEIDDCYFTFSNEEVNRLLQDSENKYRAGYGFRDGYEFSEDDINEIRTMINQMDSFASPEKGKQIFENAFSRVTDVYKEGAEAEVSYGIHAGLIAKLCSEMVLQIVLQTLFTPKVMMVLQVNNYVMRKNNGELDFSIDFLSLMRALIGVIYNIVKEIVEKFLQDLLEFMLAKLRSIIAAFATGLIKEQLDYWLRLITQIILACGFRIRNYNEGGIDNVMYADIAENNQKPKTSEC